MSPYDISHMQTLKAPSSEILPPAKIGRQKMFFIKAINITPPREPPCSIFLISAKTILEENGSYLAGWYRPTRNFGLACVVNFFSNTVRPLTQATVLVMLAGIGMHRLYLWITAIFRET